MEIRLSIIEVLILTLELIIAGAIFGVTLKGGIENGYLYSIILIFSAGILILKRRKKKTLD